VCRPKATGTKQLKSVSKTDTLTGRDLLPELSIFELAFLTVIADAMARLKDHWSGEKVYALMDQRVRTLLSLRNICMAIERDLERYADQWTPEQLAGIEQRLSADVAEIRDRRVRRQYWRYFKRQIEKLCERVDIADRVMQSNPNLAAKCQRNGRHGRRPPAGARA
jgi:hypothetical protein